MPARASKPRRVRRATPHSTRCCATTKCWRSRIIATTRPKPSCCAHCGLRVPTAWGRCGRWRRFGAAGCGGRCSTCRARCCSSTRDAHELDWIDDASNEDTALDRNYLRHRVLPLLRERWPHADAAFALSAALCAEAAVLLADEDAAALAAARGADPDMLLVDKLTTLPAARRARVLRRWIERIRHCRRCRRRASHGSKTDLITRRDRRRGRIRLVRRRRAPLARPAARAAATRGPAGGLGRRMGRSRAAGAARRRATRRSRARRVSTMRCACIRAAAASASPCPVATTRTRSSMCCRTSAYRRGCASACRCCRRRMARCWPRAMALLGGLRRLAARLRRAIAVVGRSTS